MIATGIFADPAFGGFFAAFGIFLFYLFLSVILGLVALGLAAAGAFNINTLLPG